MTGPGRGRARPRGAERVAIDANGLTFAALVAGPPDGRPVLLLHGFPQSSATWQPTVEVLAAAGFRAVAPDQRGYSASARPAEVAAYAVPELVSDVLAIADTMAMGAFDLVGHDWGGMLAWVVAARYPERVRSLTVVSTPHPEALRAVVAAGDAEQAGHLAAADDLRPAREPERFLLGDEDGGGTPGLRRLLMESGLDAERSGDYVAALAAPGALTAALNWYRAMDPADVAGLPPVVVPTLYVWSAGDLSLGRRAAEATAEWVAGRYQFEVLGGSHWVPEQAGDELHRLLLAHLQSA